MARLSIGNLVGRLAAEHRAAEALGTNPEAIQAMGAQVRMELSRRQLLGGAVAAAGVVTLGQIPFAERAHAATNKPRIAVSAQASADWRPRCGCRTPDWPARSMRPTPASVDGCTPTPRPGHRARSRSGAENSSTAATRPSRHWQGGSTWCWTTLFRPSRRTPSRRSTSSGSTTPTGRPAATSRLFTNRPERHADLHLAGHLEQPAARRGDRAVEPECLRLDRDQGAGRAFFADGRAARRRLQRGVRRPDDRPDRAEHPRAAGLPVQPGQFSIFGLSDERYHIRGGNDQLPKAIAAALPTARST